MLKASLKVRIDSLIICAFLALMIYSFLPFDLFGDFFPETVNNMGFIILYIAHAVIVVLGSLVLTGRGTIGGVLVKGIVFLILASILSWFGLTFFYVGAVGSGLRVYFLFLPLIFSIFNGFEGDLVKNAIRYIGLYCMYTMLLIFA